MTQPTRLVKVAVLASSMLLAGGFVLYRGGVLDTLLDTDGVSSPKFVDDAYAASERTMPDTPMNNPSRTAPGDNGDDRADTPARRRAFFPSSKSGVFVDRDEPDTARASVDTTPRREVFMGGSKSLAPLVTPRKPDTVDEKPRREVFMGGSKSLAPLVTPRKDSSVTRYVDSSVQQSKKR